jgi:hypothetical protein
MKITNDNDRVDCAINALLVLANRDSGSLDEKLIQRMRATYSLLKKWGNSEEICNAGLFHPIYLSGSPNDTIISLDKRLEIINIIGKDSEEIVYFYGACDRVSFYPQLLNEGPYIIKDRFALNTTDPTIQLVRALCEITLATELEHIFTSTSLMEKFSQSFVWFVTSSKWTVSERAFEDYSKLFHLSEPKRDKDGKIITS